MNKVHVAFVDDEEFLHKLVKMKLRKEIASEQVQTYHFYDGIECLNYIRENKENLEIVLLFSDITMPNMDGITLVDHLSVEFPELSVYMASALDIEEYKQRVPESTAKDFLAKPLDFNMIKKIILEHIQQKD